MAESRDGTLEAMGRRVTLIRRAFSAVQRHEKDLSVSAFARLCGIGIQALHNVESAKNRIGLDNAIAVCRRTGATLDYIFFGQPANLPHALALAIQKLEQEGSPVKRRRSARR